MASRRYPSQITYWAVLDNDGYGGFKFSAPVTINARWEDTVAATFNVKGDAIVSKAVVYVDQDVAEDGYLYNGVSSEADPTAVALQGAAFKIQRITKTPNIRYSDYIRKVIL